MPFYKSRRSHMCLQQLQLTWPTGAAALIEAEVTRTNVCYQTPAAIVIRYQDQHCLFCRKPLIRRSFCSLGHVIRLRSLSMTQAIRQLIGRSATHVVQVQVAQRYYTVKYSRIV
ncbi:hypothetical protein cyc_03431 [Cyclospora cayetanensis]|uniref:Uncharacterized protein n=1 Tax=Cyclospora cayetanensis TaxID=88456 RepID=A0A1D3CYW3_9EIME|nr:hypothetical protein cyc_03431 [Cyclospora cayetanensis]